MPRTNESGKRWYSVTMRATAEMVVWVEADSPERARKVAARGDYDHMTHWEPINRVRSTHAVTESEPPELSDG